MRERNRHGKREGTERLQNSERKRWRIMREDTNSKTVKVSRETEGKGK